MKGTVMFASLVMLASVGLGCPKKEPEGKVTLSLDNMPELVVTAPEGTTVSKNALGLGVMLQGPGVSMTVGKREASDPRTLDEAKKNAESYSPKDMKVEDLSDGFILTYTNEGNMGVNYWLVGRRVIDGTTYTCGVKSPKQEHQTSGVAICKSLTK